MSKSNRSLVVLVHPSLFETPAVVDLIRKENVVDSMATPSCTPKEYDLVIGPNCWRIVPGMEQMIDIAVKAVRKQKYGKEKADMPEL